MKSIRLALLGATFLAGASAFSAANAADVYAREGSLKDEPAYMPAITWSGFYIGAHVGGLFNDDVTVTGSFLGTTVVVDGDFNETWLAGVHAGYNWQRSNIVFGVEGDWDGLGDRDLGPALTGGREPIDENWLASVRGRLGYAAGSALIYATGGVAFLSTEFRFPADGTDETHIGWVAGGGIDYKLRQNVSIGLEALYYSIGDRKTVTDFSTGVPVPVTADIDRDFFTVRARLTYHFGGDRYAEPLK